MVLSMDVDTRLLLFTPNRKPVTAAVCASSCSTDDQSDESKMLDGERTDVSAFETERTRLGSGVGDTPSTPSQASAALTQ